MATEVIQVICRSAVLDNTPAAATALANLRERGIELLAISELPSSADKRQLDLTSTDGETLSAAAAAIGLTLSGRKTGFLIRSNDAPGSSVAGIVQRLAAAHIGIASMQAVAAGAGRFGALVWVQPTDLEEAAKVLGAIVPAYDLVEEASRESFPASDAPGWIT